MLKVTMSVDPAVRRLLASFRQSPVWDQELDVEVLRKLWPSLVGPQLAGATTVTGIRGSTVVINVPDLIWRRQLLRMKFQLLKRINEPWPTPWIKEIAITYEN
jgi:predicted nucleic acid-binding Zn ribbon protein